MCGALATSCAVRVEDRAGEVEPLLDVDRAGGLLEHDAHLLGDVHEQPVEHLETIGSGARWAVGRGAPADAGRPAQHQHAARRDRRPAGRDKARCAVLSR